MIANYGYTDGSGDWYITIDTDKCNACGDCVAACPQGMFEIVVDDYDEEVASVKEEHRKSIKYLCGPCKPNERVTDPPCIKACVLGAISHSW